jgi:RNA polymerase sigma-70 factor (ECF subfamily)
MASGSWRDITLTDDAIIEKVLAGDGTVFEVLVRRHQERVYRAVRAIMKNEAETEDVMQQAYVSAFTNLKSFAHGSQFSTWLTRIAINGALSRLRVLGRAAGFEEPDAEPPMPAHQNPERLVAAHELMTHVEAAIDELPDRYRVVLVLRDVEGMSSLETAECLGLTEEAVRVRLHRAKAMLRESIAVRIHASPKDLFQFAAPRCDRMVDQVLDILEAA